MLVASAVGTTALLIGAALWTQAVFGDRLLPHAFCITASPPLLWLHAVSDVLISVAYLLIPWSILRFARRRADIPFGWVAWLFGAFILACGSTHALEAVTLWDPVYWYSGVAKAFTAVASLGTAWALYKLTPLALALPSVAQIRSLNADLMREVAARKETESELRAAQSKLEQLLQDREADVAELEVLLDRFFANAPVGMAVVDEGSLIVRANPALSRITRRSPSAFEVGAYMGALSDIPTEARQSMAAVLKQHKTVEGLTYSRPSPAGEITLRVTYFPISSPSAGTLAGVLVEDITEQRRAEQEKQAAMEAAQDASRSRDEFLARVSHELRSPLQVALLSLEALRRGVQAPEASEKLLTRLTGAVRQQAAIINDLLDLSRALSGKVHLESAHIDPLSPLSAVLDTCRTIASQRQIAVEVSSNGPAAVVFADPARLQQVYANLIDNAIRFTANGTTVTVETLADEGRFVAAISDEGPGLDPEEVSSLFKPFSQGRNQPAEGKGLGLGLAIASAIVAAHGGRLWAKNNPNGRGAQFFFELPIATAEAAPTPNVSIPDVDLSGLRILCVEDDTGISEGLALGLASLGAQPTVANSYASALRAFVQGEFDIVLCDINLGDGPSGLDVARFIRGTSKGASVPLIALSAYGRAGDRAGAHEAGFSTLLVKPVNMPLLALEVVHATGGREPTPKS